LTTLWWQWVDTRIDARLEAHGESVGEALGDFCGPQFAAMKRELELLRREVVQLREQVGLERELKELRSEVGQARGEIPKVPAIVEQLEAKQARLKRELETTREKLKNMRVDQAIASYRLAELDKATAKRAKALELKVETTSFAMREIDPGAAAALRDFATKTLESARRDEKVWVFDPSPAAGTA
jgi:predicted RNase H-like nuclease (RuvC/YqgF family)